MTNSRWFFIKSFLVRKIWGSIQFDRICSLLKSTLIVRISHTPVLGFIIFLSAQLVPSATCILYVPETAVIPVSWSLRVVHLSQLVLKCRVIIILPVIIMTRVSNVDIVQVFTSLVETFINIWMNLRNLVAFIDSGTIVKDWIIDSICSFANRESETATNCNLEDLLILYCLKSSWMISHFTISDPDFAVWIRAPNHSFVICIHNHKEWSSNIDTTD